MKSAKKRVALVALGVIALVFAIAALSVLTSKKAYAAEIEFRWEHFGADPYAGTRTEAMQTRESAFRKLGFPQPVIVQFMRVTEKPGEKIRLTMGNRLGAMLSKGGAVHHNVVVAFTKPPVSNKMEYAAPAEKWQVSFEGNLYTVILPEICYNWSRIDVLIPSSTPPVISADTCVELTFNAPVGGHVRWGVATTRGPLPPDACNAQRQDTGAWTAWYGECDICIPPREYVRGILGDSVQIPHKYRYAITQAKQTLRFSTAVWNTLVYLCLEDEQLVRTCGVYIRPQDWKGRYRVEIPDAMWDWNDANCPQ